MQALTVYGSVTSHHAIQPPTVAIPRQLRSALAHFTDPGPRASARRPMATLPDRIIPTAAYSSSVSIMASNVWVLAPKNHKYIRGSEIIEVKVHTSRGYGADDAKDSTITITQARTVDNKAGTCPDTLDLWSFTTWDQADKAAVMLLCALATDPPAVVCQGDDGVVRVQPLTTD
jgi:hypothetical protein